MRKMSIADGRVTVYSIIAISTRFLSPNRLPGKQLNALGVASGLKGSTLAVVDALAAHFGGSVRVERIAVG